MYVRVLFVLGVVFFQSSFAFETKKQQIIGAQTAAAEAESNYAMVEFKKENFGIDFDEVVSQLLERIQNNDLTAQQARQELVRFAATFRDGHMNIARDNDDYSSVGIEAAAIDERLFVVGFDKGLYVHGRTVYPLEIGDEIIEIDGTPVIELGLENLPYVQRATYATRMQRALERTMNRPHSSMIPMKEGQPIKIKFRRHDKEKNTDKEFEGSFQWIHAKGYKDLDRYSTFFRVKEDDSDSAARKKRQRSKNTPVDPKTKKKEEHEEKSFVFGKDSKKTYFRHGLNSGALGAKKILDVTQLINSSIEKEEEKDPENNYLVTNSRLDAYIIRHGKYSFGVLRIPDYSPDSSEDIIPEYRWYSKAIEIFEGMTDGLIIDHLGNGGGYVDLAIRFLQMFANEGPLLAMKAKFKLSEAFLRELEKPFETIEPPQETTLDNPLDKALARPKVAAEFFMSKQRVKKLRESYERGEQWSDFSSYFEFGTEGTPNDIGKIFADGNAVYTKPVMFLNDSRSGSCGDMVPAILKANGRILVMGEDSMGLGGTVYREQEALPGSEMWMRCTQALCIPSNDVPVENVGVTPDIRREVKPEDLTDNFVSYAKEVLDTMTKYVAGTLKVEVTKVDEKKLRWAKTRLAKKYKLTEKDWPKVLQISLDYLREKDVFLRPARSEGAVVERLEELARLQKLEKRDLALVNRLLELIDKFSCSKHLRKSKKT
ncbi:MAG: S41 family peptidase [Bacteriovoracia bacterium]